MNVPWEIKKMIIEKAELLKSTRSRWVNALVGFVKHNNELIKYFNIDNLEMQLFMLLTNIDEIPICICGKHKKYFHWRFLQTCGDKTCINSSRQASYTKTVLETWGVHSHTQSSQFKEKIRKEYFEKTGYKHPWQNPEVRKHCSNTMKQKTGYSSALANPEIQRKRKNKILQKFNTLNMFSINATKNTMLEKYGVENIMLDKVAVKQISQKMRNTKLDILRKKLQKFNNVLVDTTEYNYVKIQCNCGEEYEIPNSSLNFFLRNDINPCPICNPKISSEKNTSKSEQELFDYIKNIINYNVVNRWIVWQAGEIDVYCKSFNLGFELNGVYWHSELYRDDTYHALKTTNMLKKGIKLIHIWEDDWNYKREIVYSRIKALLNIFSEKIYARKTQLVKISQKDFDTFCEKNHLQGTLNTLHRYGLYYDNDLVQVMSFSRSRGFLKEKKDNVWELTRFCTKNNISVIGGASKLFSAFIKEIQPEEIVSYCDRCWTPDYMNSVYLKLGFYLEKLTEPNFTYVIHGKRESRMKYQKKNLIKKGFDKNMTAYDIMRSQNFYRIYDAGNWKFRWKK